EPPGVFNNEVFAQEVRNPATPTTGPDRYFQATRAEYLPDGRGGGGRGNGLHRGGATARGVRHVGNDPAGAHDLVLDRTDQHRPVPRHDDTAAVLGRDLDGESPHRRRGRPAHG